MNPIKAMAPLVNPPAKGVFAHQINNIVPIRNHLRTSDNWNTMNTKLDSQVFSNMRLLCCVFATVMLTLAISYSQQSSPTTLSESVIRAQRFELVDASGKSRLVIATIAAGAAGIFAPNEDNPAFVIATKPSGNPVVFLTDTTGNRRIELSAVEERAFLRINNAEGYSASITALPDQVGVGLNDRTKRTTAFLTVNRDNPGLNLKKDTTEIVLGAIESSSGLFVNGPTRQRASISILPGVASGVDLMDAKGKRRGISTEGDQK